jgi:hypothetical protein
VRSFLKKTSLFFGGVFSVDSYLLQVNPSLPSWAKQMPSLLLAGGISIITQIAIKYVTLWMERKFNSKKQNEKVK